MEALDPEQRAVYLLREVFDYSYAEIAEMVEKSEAACRQMVSRARRYLRDRRPKHSVNRSQSEQAVRQFMNAINKGDLAGLMETLDADVIWTSDGGGMRGVARKPISGRDKVARFILALAERAPTGISLRITWINGQPGMIISVEGEPYATLSLAVHEGRVASIWAVVNPDKMEHIRQNTNS
jgi:RNA polymerase sigma-70 factor (ECF subfamily)